MLTILLSKAPADAFHSLHAVQEYEGLDDADDTGDVDDFEAQMRALEDAL